VRARSALDRDEDRHAVAVFGIGHDDLEARGLWNGLAVFDKTFDMKGKASSAMARASSRSFPAVIRPGRSGNDTP
jgi:hypothetical protein